MKKRWPYGKFNNSDKCQKYKETATIILKDLGLNMSTTINMFLTQIVKRNDIPFEIKNPKPKKELMRH